MKLDPEAARIRKEHAKSTRQRVEVRREDSGNASIAGRELDTATALACKANVDAIAVRLRNHGHLDGTLSSISALRHDRAPPGPRPPRPDPAPANPAVAPCRRPGRSTAASVAADPSPPITPASPTTRTTPAPTTATDPDGARYARRPGRPGRAADEAAGTPTRSRTPATTTPTPTADADAERTPSERRRPRPAAARCAPAMPAPLPASINLLVPIGTLLGWSAAPAQANGIGLLDPDETRALVQAASRHPRTRWCATIIDPDGTASAHGLRPRPTPLEPHRPQRQPQIPKPRRTPNHPDASRPDDAPPPTS